MKLTAAVLAIAYLHPLLARAANAKPKLVPARFTAVQDSLGFHWDVNQQGGISNGSNCFSNACALEVNGNGFSPQSPLMTPDGREFVLSRDMSGIAVTRRVAVDVKNGLCRWVESFRNSSPQPQTVNAVLNMQFNNQMQAIVTDSGATAGAALGAKECGLAAIPNPNTGGQIPGALWMLGTPGTKARPQISNESNYRLRAVYTLNLAPGETVAILHCAAQRNLPGANDPKSLGKLFTPLKSARVAADLTAAEGKTLANFRAGAVFATGEIATLPALLDEIGVERGGFDVLAVGADTRLRGAASCAGLKIESRFGPLEIPFEKVAALTGGAAHARVILRDGQSLSGPVSVRGFKFSLSTGTTVELDFRALDRLVMRISPEDGKPPADAWGMVETFDGDRLAIRRAKALKLRASTAWGARELDPDEIVAAGPTAETPLGFSFALKDGSRFVALLAGEKIALDTLLFGRKEFAASSVRRLATVQQKPEDDASETPASTLR